MVPSSLSVSAWLVSMSLSCFGVCMRTCVLLPHGNVVGRLAKRRRSFSRDGSRTKRTHARTSTRTAGEYQETGFRKPCARRSVTPREEARSPAKTHCSSSDLLSKFAADHRRRRDEVYQE